MSGRSDGIRPASQLEADASTPPVVLHAANGEVRLASSAMIADGADAHGRSLAIDESEAGGARFEIAFDD